MIKILVVTKPEEQSLWEEMLYEVVREGRELFIANALSQAAMVIMREHPHLIFFDEQLLEDEELFWRENYGEALVVVRKGNTFYPNDVEHSLLQTQVLERCQVLLPQLQRDDQIFLM